MTGRILIPLLTEDYTVNQERATQILEEMANIGNIVLATDTTFGPEYLKEVLYEASRQQSVTAQRSQEIIAAMRLINRRISEQDMEFKLLKSEKLATDPHILRLPSAKDRENRAEHDLRDKKKELDSLIIERGDLDLLEKIVKDKKTALKNLSADIKQQKQLMVDDNPYGQDLTPGRSRKGKNLSRIAYGQSYADKPLESYPATVEGLADDVEGSCEGPSSLEDDVDDAPTLSKASGEAPDYDDFLDMSPASQEDAPADPYDEALSFL